jgi:LmbE family N-acetylglucosaminyl deacetylase
MLIVFMHSKSFLHQLRINLLCRLRATHAAVVSRWILQGRSQSLEPSQKSAIVFSPHQDDETLGCGGMIALKREQGVPVRVVFLTDGRGSHRSHLQVKSEELMKVRKQEALAALTTLGISPSEIYFLDLPDGMLQQLPETQHQQATEQLTQILQSFRPEEVYVPHRKDRHQDHEATYELVSAAIAHSGIQVELLQYPIWLLWQAPLLLDLKLRELAGAYRLSIRSVQDKKKQAIAAYRSQYLPLESDSALALPPGFLKQFFLPCEIFFKITGEGYS